MNGGSIEPEPSDEIERLRRENALLEALLEAASELVDVVSADGTLMRTFRKRARQLGYDPDEIEGSNVLALVHPDDAGAARDALALLASGPGAQMRIELRLRRKDGTWVPFECVAENRTDDPAVGGIVVCTRDVSWRVELENQLRLAQRTESVGRLATGIVHDFNNVLGVIRLAASRARASEEAVPRALEAIAGASDAGASLTKRLLSFVRSRPVERRVVDLGRLVAAAEATLRSVVPEHVALDLSISVAPVPVLAEPTEIEHVLLNLVLNARDALGVDGSIGIAAGVEGGVGTLVVRDDGAGMPEATLRRAFEPFFTTKSAEQGTGLGLWTVQESISRCGGTVRLRSEVGRGTEVRIELPLADSVASETARPGDGVRRRLDILLVEDEPRLRSLFVEALEHEGHRVWAAADGRAALDRVEAEDLRPDALVSDVRMPRLGGTELAARLRNRDPEILVLFATGFGDGEEEFAREDERARVLTKPFTADRLVETLDELAGLARGADRQ